MFRYLFIGLVLLSVFIGCSELGGSNDESDDSQQNDENSTEISVGTIERGKELYEQESDSERSCLSCHGPEGNLDAEGFETLNEQAHDLRKSLLENDELTSKIESMWDGYTSYGSGNFSILPSSDQESLRIYLVSLQTESSDEPSEEKHSHEGDEHDEDELTESSGESVEGGHEHNDEHTDETDDSAKGEHEQNDENSTEISVGTIERGKELYEQESDSERSCLSCHGPEGNLDAEGFETLNEQAHDLRKSLLENDELTSKIESMWDGYTSYGSGNFSILPSSDQESLRIYLVSLQTESSSPSDNDGHDHAH